MNHRHITDESYSLAAIDSVIERGQRKDWALLQISMRDNVAAAFYASPIKIWNILTPYVTIIGITLRRIGLRT